MSFIRAGARRHPDRLAWVDAGQQLSYAALWRLASRAVTGHYLVHSEDNTAVMEVIVRGLVGGATIRLAPWHAGPEFAAGLRTRFPDATAVHSADACTPGPITGGGSVRITSTGTTGTPTTRAFRPRLLAVPMLLGLLGSLPVPPHPRVACLTRVDAGHGLALFVATMALGGTYVAPGGPLTGLDVLSGVPRQLARVRDVQVPLVLCGSDPLTPEVARDLRERLGGEVVDAYGSTETGTIALDGRLLPGVRVRIVDGVVEVHSPLADDVFRGDRGRIEGGRLVLTGRVR